MTETTDARTEQALATNGRGDSMAHWEAMQTIRTQAAEIARLRDALGAHIQADAYRDTFPDNAEDAASLRKCEVWWRITGRSWVSEELASQCAEAAKARVASGPGMKEQVENIRAKFAALATPEKGEG